MPTEVRSASAPIIGRSKASNISPFAVAATAAFVVLHLVSGVMLERSHASPTIASSAYAALDDEAKCPAEARQPERFLPYD
jgi:hypothetical protein